MHGTAHAWTSTREAPSTRRHAALSVGTQVLARREEALAYELAVIVRVDGARAFVVYADGRSAWIGERDVLAPELAAGDAVQAWNGSRFVPAEIVERVGPALRVLRADGVRTWTSDARVRVRGDAMHARGEGIDSDVPSEAWIEARIDDAWRPGIAVWRRMGRVQVALSDGSAHWLDIDEVRPQRIGPGVRVRVDGWPRSVIVAARIGHALAVVDEDGTRSWTALSRVARAAP
jgi:hypothetical protein